MSIGGGPARSDGPTARLAERSAEGTCGPPGVNRGRGSAGGEARRLGTARRSALAEALQAICELDLSELESVAPPRGFGRD